MKTKLNSYERPFKVKKDGVFLFLMSFIVPEILTILYYADWIADDVMGLTVIGVKTQNRWYH